MQPHKVINIHTINMLNYLKKKWRVLVRYVLIVISAAIVFNVLLAILVDNNVTGNKVLVKDCNSNKKTATQSRVVKVICWIFTCKPTTLPLCPDPPPNLEGAQIISFEKPEIYEIEHHLTTVEMGGSWKPQSCQSRVPDIAIIVPYRDRPDHLRIFLNYIHPFLQKQQLQYTLYIVEQAPGSQFNRAMLLNIGYIESLRHQAPACVIFHDVDLLPEDDRNLYECTEGAVRHLSAHVDELAYRLPYDGIVGGAVTFWAKDFMSINGFSNKFFGWGGEDDDLYNRIKYHGLNITRYNKIIARYKMIRHRKLYPNKERFKFLQTGDRRFLTDGLNSLKYERKKLEKRKLYTWIYVNINQTTYQ